MGDFAIPFMVDELRITRDKDVYAGILEAITQLEGPTMAGLGRGARRPHARSSSTASSRAIAARDDVLNLQTFAQTDLAPFLWRVMAQPDDQNPTLQPVGRASCSNKLHPGVKADLQHPRGRTRRHRPRSSTTTRPASPAPRPTPTARPPPSRCGCGTPRPDDPKLDKLEDVPVGQAEEYYGLRYARWALERQAGLRAGPGADPGAGRRAGHRAGEVRQPRDRRTGRLQAPLRRAVAVLDDLLDRGLSRKKTGARRWR